jgi:hypothetical protein
MLDVALWDLVSFVLGSLVLLLAGGVVAGVLWLIARGLDRVFPPQRI